MTTSPANTWVVDPGGDDGGAGDSGDPFATIGHAVSVAGPGDEIVVELLVDVMLGLWNDGWRKQIIINNHGQLWVLEEALHEFCKRYQLPGIYRVIDWHRAIREFFYVTDRPDSLSTEISPPIIPTSDLEIVRPSPVPRSLS